MYIINAIPLKQVDDSLTCYLPGIAGAAILYAVTPEKFRGDLGRTILHDDVTVGQAIGVEAILTFLVVLTLFAATDTARKANDLGAAPLVIGIAYFAAHLMGVSSKMRTYLELGSTSYPGSKKRAWSLS